LLGRIEGDPFHEQGVDGTRRIVAMDARQARIDHTPNAIDCDGGFGDIG
jgi:hypothetical protein